VSAAFDKSSSKNTYLQNFFADIIEAKDVIFGFGIGLVGDMVDCETDNEMTW